MLLGIVQRIVLPSGMLRVLRLTRSMFRFPVLPFRCLADVQQVLFPDSSVTA
jgi:hypothetical protein